ncbi:DNA-directed DNA polymerase, putative [Cryptococcus gattii WM276]|uniref:DNA-directed DNA polymerase, putative n=1 Tax=Cryptococcus gattii serotype B (strain WM276 / ATCC MYA-4071) TaxID=367775 RepID=E6R306_CRYGW|nr:DNA-directed DNA polymerase, putative [Cryptococcus gattii WM276]ADV20875.1 DNA-directed DNA polymerase, putative [Cryptococcus gattii WM276]KJE01617.1 DNA polymerase phi subunit [Cryptococcus gattii NT-10]
MTSNVLPLFWPLSNSSKETRLAASASLVSSLESFQQSFSQNVGSSKGKEIEDEDEDSASDSEESGMEVDASDDEEENNERDSQAAKLDRQLSKDNAEDVVYSVKRLVRGLGSSRESSRLGFAVALTELLSRIPTVTARQVFSLVIRNSQYSKNMKGSDERDMMFARLFGMTAIVQSQSLFASSATKADFRGVIEELQKLGQAKAWMRESAWWTLVQSVQLLLGSRVQWKEDALQELVDVVFEEKGWTQEKVALVLTLEQSGLDLDWKTHLAPTFKYNPLLDTHNLLTLGRILKETTGDEGDGVSATITGSWKPQLHFVWNIIFDRYFGPSALSTTLAPFQDFFRVVVDESLFSNTSSPQRRYWGFQVFERALPLLPSSQMPLIFTPNFMRCWMNNLSSPDRYLHKAAQQIAKKVQEIIKENPKVGFTLLSQLVGKHGRPDFDKVTKTKTVESIMGKLNEEGVKDFVNFLKETILGASHENLDTARLTERRSWALDQIQALCRNGSVPKDDTWVSPLLDFLLVHGFFIIRSANKKSPISAIHSVPALPLSENTSSACRAKFFACALELTTASIPRKSGSEVSKARQQGCDASGRLWLRRAVDIVSILVQDKKHVEVIADADEEIKSIRNTALKSLSSFDKFKENQKSISRAFEILISFFILQTYDEVEDSLENLEEVNAAAQQYLGQEEEKDAQAVDMLLDVLIALLDKGSSDLRNLANLVFGIISPELTKSSLDLLAAQLEQSAAEAAANESEEESDEDAEGDEAASGSDDGQASEEDEDEEEEQEDDEDLGEVDPAFRQRVAEALKVSGMDAGEDVEEGSEAESEEYWDDDQMMKVDEQLAQVFRERAAATSKNDMKHILTESIHFKNRILDFYDTYAKRQPANPLIIDVVLTLLKLIRTGGVSEAEVSNKAAGILRSKFNKPKDVPSTVDVEVASECLKTIHSMAQKAHSAEFSTLCSLCSLFVSRAIDASETTSNSATSTVVEIYRATLKDFMTRKASLVHPPFLLEFVKRFPLRAFSLHHDLVTYVAPGAAVNTFRQLQAYNALQILAQHLPVISKSVSPSEVVKLVQEASGSVFTTIETAAEASVDSKDALNAQKLKDVAKFALQLARNSKNVGVSWDIRRVSEVGEKLKHGQRTKEMKGVHSMWTQLEAILGNKKGEKRKR